MTEDEFYMADLLFRSFGEGVNEEEQRVIDKWKAASAANEDLWNMLDNDERFREVWREYVNIDVEEAWTSMETRYKELKPPHGPSRIGTWLIQHWKPIGYAALGAATVAAIVLIPKKRDPIEVHQTLGPAGHFASLQLDGGQDVALAAHPAGLIDSSECTRITKSADGTIDFDRVPGCSNAQPATKPATWHLKTPRGGYYSARLTDGTTVQLNAESSISFPARFDTEQREVFLRGEGYFEVAPAYVQGRSQGTFIVHTSLDTAGPKGPDSNALTITSLGTRFDVKAYPGEGGILTTLLEGTLILRKGRDTLTLRSGQSALLDDKGKLRLLQLTAADTAAWKDGQFQLIEQPLGNIVAELSRWYDVKISWSGQHAQRPYTLKGFNRTQSLQELLDQLRLMSGAHFTIEKDTIPVSH